VRSSARFRKLTPRSRQSEGADRQACTVGGSTQADKATLEGTLPVAGAVVVRAASAGSAAGWAQAAAWQVPVRVAVRH
jgi:hypothetical protein